MDWQPIESAPKDGTRLLLLRRQKVSGPTLTKNPVIGSWAAKRGYRAYWSLEITCNNYWAGDADLLGWLPLPHNKDSQGGAG